MAFLIICMQMIGKFTSLSSQMIWKIWRLPGVQCIVDVNNWMLPNNLKLNQDKSEPIVMHAKHRLKPSLESFQVGESTIVPPDSARNI